MLRGLGLGLNISLRVVAFSFTRGTLSACGRCSFGGLVVRVCMPVSGVFSRRCVLCACVLLIVLHGEPIWEYIGNEQSLRSIESGVSVRGSRVNPAPAAAAAGRDTDV